MDFILNVLAGFIANILTDLSKKVIGLDVPSGVSTGLLQPGTVPPATPGSDAAINARRALNHARFEAAKSAVTMVVWCLLLLFCSALLPIILKGYLIHVDFSQTRLSWLLIENAGAYAVAGSIAALAFIPVFLAGQNLAKFIGDIYHREWADVSRGMYIVFFVRALLPILIVYSGIVVFCFYPNLDLIESMKYPLYFLGAMFVVALMNR